MIIPCGQDLRNKSLKPPQRKWISEVLMINYEVPQNTQTHAHTHLCSINEPATNDWQNGEQDNQLVLNKRKLERYQYFTALPLIPPPTAFSNFCRTSRWKEGEKGDRESEKSDHWYEMKKIKFELEVWF